MIESLSRSLQFAASFLVVLGPLVFFHELGHFLAARYFGIGTPIFSFGFGPRLFGIRRGGTDYRFSLIPLGGYVSMQGDETATERTGAPEEFLSRPRWQRVIVYLAGPVFNIILAIAVGTLMFAMYGKDEVRTPSTFPTVAEVEAGSTAEAAGIRVGDKLVSIAGKDARDTQVQVDEVVLSPGTTKTVEIERDGARRSLALDTGRDPKYHLGAPGWRLYQESPGAPRIETVLPGEPADRAGLRRGDLVLGVDDRKPVGEVELRALLSASPGREVQLLVEREGQELRLPVTPRDDGGRGRIGVEFRLAGRVHRDLGIGEAFVASLEMNWGVTESVFLTLKKLFRAEISVRAFSGPIEIARVSREAVRGFEPFLAFMTLISLQLGLLNLLPIPVLDGGHILILAMEGIARRDFSEKLKERVIMAGFVFLIAFFGVVIYFDVIKTWFSS